MLQWSILCMQGTQYATKRSILCRGAFCGPTMHFVKKLTHCATNVYFRTQGCDSRWVKLFWTSKLYAMTQ